MKDEKCAICGSTKNLIKKVVTGREKESCVTICKNCDNKERFPKLDERRRWLIAELDKVVAEMSKMIAEAQK